MKVQWRSKLSYTVQTNSGGWDRGCHPYLWSHLSQKKDLRFRRCVSTASKHIINTMRSRECFSVQRTTFAAVRGARTELPRLVASWSWWVVITLWGLAICPSLTLVHGQPVWISNSAAGRIMLEVSEAAWQSACPCLTHITNTTSVVGASCDHHLMFSTRLLSATTGTLLLQALKGHGGWL